jgi:lipopolysaccharide/colanic/teichoic acid biosynthesis glycosyltransferase
MVVPNRKIFFFIDYMTIAMVLGLNVFFWGQEKFFLAIYLGMTFCLYAFFLFLFNGSFIRIELSRRNLRANFSALLKGIVAANFCTLALLFFFFKPYRGILFYHTLATTAALLILLCLLRAFEGKYFWPRWPLRLLLLGEDPYQHLYLRDILSRWREGGEILIATGAESSGKKHPSTVVLGGGLTISYISVSEAKGLLLSEAHFTAVVLGRDPLGKELMELLPLCYQNCNSVMGIGPFYESVCRKLPLFQVGSSWLVHTSFQSPGPEVAFLKRALDLFLGIFCLLVLLPVGLVVALAIKLDSRGPVFFIQDRTGRGNKPFRMYKFRSMKTHADDSHEWPRWEPDLVTRVGHIIRDSGLDEIPQLINIIKGDMSFVGPRPARPMVTERHMQKVPFYAISLAMRPGVTGWAQLRQGQDTGDESMLNKVRYNLYYAKNFSLWFDLEIIFKTARIVFFKEKPMQFRELPSAYFLSEKEKIRGEL